MCIYRKAWLYIARFHIQNILNQVDGVMKSLPFGAGTGESPRLKADIRTTPGFVLECSLSKQSDYPRLALRVESALG